MQNASLPTQQPVVVPIGTTVLLNFGVSSASHVVTPARGVLEVPPGTFHLPNGAIGLLRAVGAGTAKITVTLSGQFPSAVSFSPNWSGYAKPVSTTSVTGQWTVPTVFSSGATNTFSSDWIGIDGFNNTSLIQTGTEADWINGQPLYRSWWEILPAAETPIAATVLPGDVMWASITPVSGTTWQIYITDMTQNWQFQINQTYTGPQTSAEWIHEAPTNGGILTLANTTTVTYTLGTLSQGFPGLTTQYLLDMINNSSQIIAAPSGPNAFGDGFAVAYGSVAPAVPATPPFLSAYTITYGGSTGTSVSLPSSGGQVTLDWTQAHTTSCQLTSSPGISGLPLPYSCNLPGYQGFFDNITIPANTTSSPLQYSFTVSISNTQGGPVTGVVRATLAAAAVTCTPRPPVLVSAAANGGGGLSATVSVTGAGNTMQSIQFGISQNGVILYPGMPLSPGGFTVQPPAGTTTVAFTVNPAAPGAVTAFFTVMDTCPASPWKSFVGAGPNALGPNAGLTSGNIVVSTVSATPVSSATPTPASQTSPAAPAAQTTTPAPASHPLAVPAAEPATTHSAGTSPAHPSAPSRQVTSTSGGAGGGGAQVAGGAPVITMPGGPGPARSGPIGITATSVTGGIAPNAVEEQQATTAAVTTPAVAPPATVDKSTLTSEINGTVDPSQGGTLWSSDGSMAVTIAPAGVPSDTWQILVLANTAPILTDPEARIVQVGASYYEVTVLDGSGARVTSFEPSLQLTVWPDTTVLATAGGDPSAVTVGTLNPESGTFEECLPTVNDDGSLTVSVPDLQPTAAGDEPT
jgi:hypothetical protein